MTSHRDESEQAQKSPAADPLRTAGSWSAQVLLYHRGTARRVSLKSRDLLDCRTSICHYAILLIRVEISALSSTEEFPCNRLKE
jgi:hypothetical protein